MWPNIYSSRSDLEGVSCPISNSDRLPPKLGPRIATSWVRDLVAEGITTAIMKVPGYSFLRAFLSNAKELSGEQMHYSFSKSRLCSVVLL